MSLERALASLQVLLQQKEPVAPCKAPAMKRKRSAEKIAKTTSEGVSASSRAFMLRTKRVLESFVHTNTYVSHQLESYEHFLNFMLPEIIEEQSPITIYNAEQQIQHRIFFEGMSFKKPTDVEANGFLRPLYPHEALLRKKSYLFDVVINVRHKIYEGPPQDMKLVKHQLYKDINFARIPCMVGSSACHTHQNLNLPQRDKGMFVINGYEKVLVTQAQLRGNYPYVFLGKGKFTHRCEIRSCHPHKIRSTSTSNLLITAEKTTSVPEIEVAVPFVKTTIPLLVLFRLLGIDTVEQCAAYILDQGTSEKARYRVLSILQHDLSNTAGLAQEALLEWVVKKMAEECKRKHKQATPLPPANASQFSQQQLAQRRTRKTVTLVRKQIQSDSNKEQRVWKLEKCFFYMLKQAQPCQTKRVNPRVPELVCTQVVLVAPVCSE